ncbi:Double zinc ribbon [Mycoplasmopsis californica]|uniref:Zinc ribbon domain-containing protein n=1 Tax=Mycoplasmopsis equigenitalium TaxID=114883 RepID=A0ABY5J197_9BACT|nr:zinc ribbon domain-containing protein [Mycoplasmopsis equigenitalium]UUD37021.1 zinc ribbon domain-containing protein [Mycoplasmopsis equigenitalium]VEU69680.1 Double zinc ribbon [Mycoplasmopsis californica]
MFSLNKKNICKKCKVENEKDAKFCKNCGLNFKEAVIICVKCKATNDLKAKHCSQCGTQIQINQKTSWTSVLAAVLIILGIWISFAMVYGFKLMLDKNNLALGLPLFALPMIYLVWSLVFLVKFLLSLKRSNLYPSKAWVITFITTTVLILVITIILFALSTINNDVFI